MFRLKLLGLQGPSISYMFWVCSVSKSETRRIGRDVFTINENRKVNFYFRFTYIDALDFLYAFM